MMNNKFKSTKSLFKMQVTEKDLEIKINLKDLARLFKTAPQNYDGQSTIATVRPDKVREFAAFIMTMLTEPEDDDSSDINISVPFSRIFEELASGDYDFLKYKDGE